VLDSALELWLRELLVGGEVALCCVLASGLCAGRPLVQSSLWPIGRPSNT
jgi:hypothetical protein